MSRHRTAEAGEQPPTTEHVHASVEDAFEAAYRTSGTTSGTAVLDHARRRSASREDGCDVVAETVAAAWRRRADLPPDPGKVRPWLFGIARWCLANAVRSTHRASRLGQRLAASFVETSLDPSVMHEHRELVTLIAWEGLTPAKAATVLGLSSGTASVRLHRARKRLRAAVSTAVQTQEADRAH